LSLQLFKSVGQSIKAGIIFRIFIKQFVDFRLNKVSPYRDVTRLARRGVLAAQWPAGPQPAPQTAMLQTTTDDSEQNNTGPPNG